MFFGWIFAFVIGFLAIYGPYWHAVRAGAPTFTDAERTWYGSFNRLAWGVAVAWVIYACHNGVGGLCFYQRRIYKGSKIFTRRSF